MNVVIPLVFKDRYVPWYTEIYPYMNPRWSIAVNTDVFLIQALACFEPCGAHDQLRTVDLACESARYSEDLGAS